MIEVIGEYVETDSGYNFNDFSFSQTGSTQGFYVGTLNSTVFSDNELGEGQHSLGFGIFGMTGKAGFQLFFLNTGLSTDGCMGRSAVVAIVGAGYCKGELFSDFGVQLTFSQSTAEVQVSFQNGS